MAAQGATTTAARWLTTAALAAAAGPLAGCSESAPVQAHVGFGVAQGAIQLADTGNDSTPAPVQSLPAIVDPRIHAHQRMRDALPDRSGPTYLRFLSEHGLRDHPDAEDCAVYVHTRWTQGELAALRERGIGVHPDVFVPAVPGRHPFAFHLARVPYSQLSALAHDPNVVRIATTEMLARPQNDVGRAAIKADLVQAGSGVAKRTGQGVKICIADSSLDVSHPDVPMPSEVYDVTSGDAVGMWSSNVVGTVSAHGTHVVGSAVGGGGASGGKYRGMAPGASYAFYKVGDNITGDSTATEELKAIARAGIYGCDIFSLSYGSLGAEVDGSGPVEQAIDAHVANGMTFFVAAGNDGDTGQHTSVALQADTSAKVLVTVDNTKGSAAQTATFSVDAAWRDVTPGDGNISLSATGLNAGAGETFTSTDSWTTPRDTERVEYELKAVVAAGTKKTYTLTVTNAFAGNAVTVHLYLVAAPETAMFDAPEPAFTVNSPALADGALAIGAWVHRKNWTDWKNKDWQSDLTQGEAAPFSSRGPRIDGVQKPELAAPGALTVSARDSHVTVDDAKIIDDDGLNQNGSGPAHYMVMEGTSMACPAAAGAAALLLEGAPGLKPAFVRKWLTQSASSAGWPDYASGYGLIDIKAAILATENTCGDGWHSGFEQCDDGNTSGGDCCSALCKKAADGLTCSTGSMCVSNEKCLSGKCQGGVLLSCNDNQPCTDDACDPISGCSHTENVAACDDGEVCTENDKCIGKVCVGGDEPICNDTNVCTDDSCVPGAGCTYTANSNTCSDGDACTTADACVAKGCVGGPAPDCDDGNVCSTDSCNKTSGCVNVANTVACDDGNACTSGDVCKEKNCAGATTVNCDDGNVCTADDCSGGTGCLHVANTTACDDGDLCTAGDACSATLCVGGPDIACGDDNLCTDDGCSPSSGCTHVANAVPCDDGNICTIADGCSGKACVGTGNLDCNDSNPCTDDGCATPGGCVHGSNDLPCSDGSACTVNDACAAAKCVSGAGLDCGDNNPCTYDSCDAATGCKHTSNLAPCDDGLVCTTGDHCDGGSCVSSPLSCDDKNPCTDESCDPVTGCKHTANSAACDDGNACTTGDLCYWKACVSGTALFCGDANLCTNDSCDPVTGCKNIANTLACNDGDTCTLGDICAGKACVSSGPRNCDDANPCTTDGCDKVSGCTHVANAGPCNDGNACTTDDTCGAKKCVGTVIVVCNDGDPCTNDSCDAATGCKTTGNSALCDDGDACTFADMCANKACVGGTKLNCDDGNPCTIDSCDKATGCTAKANSVACNDGDPCTSSDVCKDGKCQGKDACDDGNSCTTDVCTSSMTCQHNVNTEPCDDGDACTGSGVCAAGSCKAGAAIDCGDSNLCTDDACEPQKGCTHANNSAPCEDGDACTANDKCVDGTCTAGAVGGCADAGSTDAGSVDAGVDAQIIDIQADVSPDSAADAAADAAPDAAQDTFADVSADAMPPDAMDAKADSGAADVPADAVQLDAQKADAALADLAQLDVLKQDSSDTATAPDVPPAQPDAADVQATTPDVTAAPVAGTHKAAASGCSARGGATPQSALAAWLFVVAAGCVVAKRRRDFDA